MTTRIKILSALLWLLPAPLFAAGEVYRPAATTPPEPPREFRGAWIATVANIDWPSKPGLTVAVQKAELASLLDHAVQLHLNAVIFQVRPACDAFYASPFEPWSEYLTGTMGRVPAPFYDPLAFAIQECHQRGLELHAWFNPFRAANPLGKSPVAPNHISRTHPELIRHYGSQTWLDPGEPAVREYVLRVVLDVVKRYDVDGVHLDDYFYPYPEKDAAGRELDFPDYATWKKYGQAEGYTRDDWRRKNINQFIQGAGQAIKAAKPWVKFGVSPFGIWRPQNPPPIRGLDAYGKIYADARLWLAEGWLDYCAPQLYWPDSPPTQSFSTLLNWWAQQNVKNRQLWPGLSAANVSEKFSADEMARQLKISRTQAGVSGEIFYHLRSVTENPALSNLVSLAYAQPALVPAMPWLDSTPPDRPRPTIVMNNPDGVGVRWENSGGEPAWKWILQSRATNHVWTTQLLPANQTNHVFESSSPEIISLRAVDRTGNESAPAVLAPRKNPPRFGGKGTMIMK